MVKLFLSIFLLLPFLVNGQTVDTVPVDIADNGLIMYIEKGPYFDGNLRDYIQTELKYPLSAVQDTVEGTVIVSFIIDTLGKTIFHRVVRGVRDDLNNEALRIAKKIKFDIPATQKNRPIAVPFSVPVVFDLQQLKNGLHPINKPLSDKDIIRMENLIDPLEIDEVNNLYYKLYRKVSRKKRQKAIPRDKLDFVNVYLLNYTGDCSLDSIYSSFTSHLVPIHTKRSYSISLIPLWKLKYYTSITLPRLGIQKDYILTDRTFLVDKNSEIEGCGDKLRNICAYSYDDQILVDYIKNNNVDVFSVCWNGVEGFSNYFVIDNTNNEISVISIDMDEEKENGQFRHCTFEEFVYSDFFSEWLRTIAHR